MQITSSIFCFVPFVFLSEMYVDFCVCAHFQSKLSLLTVMRFLLRANWMQSVQRVEPPFVFSAGVQPPQDRHFWSGDMKLIIWHQRGWLWQCCCHLHAVIGLGSWWCCHHEAVVQLNPGSQINKISPTSPRCCLSVAWSDRRETVGNTSHLRKEGCLFGLFWDEGRIVASGMWKVLKDFLQWKHHSVYKALQEANTQQHTAVSLFWVLRKNCHQLNFCVMSEQVLYYL